MIELIPAPDGCGLDAATGLTVLWRDFHSARERYQRDRLVLHYVPLVRSIAGRVGTGLPAHVELADLEQSGVFGLIDAIERYQPDLGPRFETYAVPRIRGAIIDELRAQDWVPRAVRGRARELERAQERLEGERQRAVSEVELAGELGIGRTELRSVLDQMHLVSIEELEERRAARGVAVGGIVDTLADPAESDPATALGDLGRVPHVVPVGDGARGA